MWRLVVFGSASLALVLVSLRSLRSPGSHGFPRFFAWEAIAGLAALNLDRWFADPLSPPQLVSWSLLVVSAVLVIEGVRLMKRIGKPQQRSDASSSTNFAFENTSKLVEIGLYRYIRHPLYASLLLLSWGIFFKVPSLPGAALAVFASGCLFATAMLEERENVRTFGSEYTAYMRRTRRFIPFVV